MPRDLSKIFQKVNHRELGLWFCNPCLPPTPTGQVISRASYSQGPCTEEGGREGHRTSPRVSAVSFSSCVNIHGRQLKSLTLRPLPGQEKPEADLEILEQSSYLSAEGCRAGLAGLNCSRCPPGPHWSCSGGRGIQPPLRRDSETAWKTEEERGKWEPWVARMIS